MVLMTPLRPHLFRAYHAWIIESGWTPYLLVDTSQEGVEVPEGYGSQGKILLNLAQSAVEELEYIEDGLIFEASFKGERCSLKLPFSAMVSLYAKETMEGIVFPEEPPRRSLKKAGPSNRGASASKEAPKHSLGEALQFFK